MNAFSDVNVALNDYDVFKDSFSDYVESLRMRAGDNMLQELADMRKLSLETIKSEGIFYITDATQMLIPSYLSQVEDFGVISPTNKKPIYHNRWVFTIKDKDGKVVNLVGYSKEAEQRYVYGTSKYYRRTETMYGLENLEYAYKVGWAILTEGITDAVRLRDLGFPNAFANCGTHNSDYIVRQLNRCRYGVIKVPDRDAAGLRASRRWKFLRSVVLNTFIQYKDIDEMCREQPELQPLVVEYINAAVEWLTSAEHRGFKSESRVLTIC